MWSDRPLEDTYEWETKQTAGRQASNIPMETSMGCHKHTHRGGKGEPRIKKSPIWIKCTVMMMIFCAPPSRHPVISIAYEPRSVSERPCLRGDDWEEGGRPSRAWRGYCWAISPWLTEQITISMPSYWYCHTSVLRASFYIFITVSPHDSCNTWVT